MLVIWYFLHQHISYHWIGMALLAQYADVVSLPQKCVVHVPHMYVCTLTSLRAMLALAFSPVPCCALASLCACPCCSHWPSDRRALPRSLSRTTQESHKPPSTASVGTTTHSTLIPTLQLWEVGQRWDRVGQRWDRVGQGWGWG